jgi:hypothetical protein
VIVREVERREKGREEYEVKWCVNMNVNVSE